MLAKASNSTDEPHEVPQKSEANHDEMATKGRPNHMKDVPKNQGKSKTSEFVNRPEHVIVLPGSKGILVLTDAEYEMHVSRNRIETAAPHPKPNGIIERAIRGGRA